MDRNAERKHLIYFSEIHDKSYAATSGRLVDISAKGLMMVTEEEVEKGKHLHLEIVLPEEIDGRDKLIFRAKCAWCKKDVNPDYYAIGFEIEEISAMDEEVLMGFIKEYGY